MRAATLLLAPLILSACSGLSSPQDPPRPVAVVLPGPAGAPPLRASTAVPAVLPGLESVELVDRERRILWQLLSQLYAPCADQAVSIQQCVQEARPCAGCKPAARLLADKIKEGATPDQARDLYGVRFGPNVKQIEPADSPSRGPADAPVTVMVWSDFECPHCGLAVPFLDRIIEKFSGRVRLVHKFYPLRQHSYAEGSARAAIAAQNQGKYWEMERILFAHQKEQTEADLLKYATELKLDIQRFRADMTAERTSKILERDHADAEKAGLSGTPLILINGREFDSAYFHLEPDLEPWIALELELLSRR